MKHLIFLFIVSLSYGNFSYQSLLLPHSTYDLVSGNSKYSIFDKFLSNQIIQNEISFSIFKLPQDVQITSMNYLSAPFNYYNYFNLNIIDYGKFSDSESNIQFDAKDIVIQNTLIKKINKQFYGLIGLNYMNSHIENYSSSLLSINSSFLLNYKFFLLEASVNNYGFVIKNYTNYDEKLPTYYSIGIMYLPRYLDSIVSIKHNVFSDYNVTNLFGELFITEDYSIIAGYTSLAKKLYFEDFSSNFFTGLSIGLNIKYADYTFNVGMKNLGSIGAIHSITLNKSFN